PGWARPVRSFRSAEPERGRNARRARSTCMQPTGAEASRGPFGLRRAPLSRDTRGEKRMRRTAIFFGLFLTLLTLSLFRSHARLDAAQLGAGGIYTYHGDNMRTGWNSHEMLLSPATVNTTQFGKLWSRPVDGQMYAQPLYALGVDMGAAGTHNLLIAATEHDSVYAFDADTGDGPLWQASLGSSVPNSGSNGVGCADIEGPEYGITGTSAI